MFGSKSIKGMSMISNAANAAHPQPSPKPASRAEMKEEHSSKEERPSMPNLIGKGTIIEGNIVAEGDLVVEGTVRGDVTTNTVEGRLYARNPRPAEATSPRNARRAA